MMRKKLMSFLVVLIVAVFVVGCSGKSKIQESDNTEVVERSPGAGAIPGGGGGGAQTQPLGGQGQGQGLGDGAGGQGGAGSGSGSGVDGMSAAEMQNLLSKRRIYFEFDSSNIDEEGRAIIEAHSAHLVKIVASPSLLKVTLTNEAPANIIWHWLNAVQRQCFPRWKH